MRLHRKLIAKLRGTFVTDCPHCHKHFYGFHKFEVNVKINKIPYRIVCPACSRIKDER